MFFENGNTMRFLFKNGNMVKSLAANPKYKNEHEQKCYDVAYRIGRCANRKIKALGCDPEDDINVPLECKRIAAEITIETENCYEIGLRHGRCLRRKEMALACNPDDILKKPVLLICGADNYFGKGQEDGVLKESNGDFLEEQEEERAKQRRPIKKQESCYSLGVRFGRCVARSIFGLSCDPRDDIKIPPRCRYDNETERGIKKGQQEVL